MYYLLLQLSDALKGILNMITLPSLGRCQTFAKAFLHQSFNPNQVLGTPGKVAKADHLVHLTGWSVCDAASSSASVYCKKFQTKKKMEEKPVVMEAKTDILYCPVGDAVWMLYDAFDPSYMYRKKKGCASVANC